MESLAHPGSGGLRLRGGRVVLAVLALAALCWIAPTGASGFLPGAVRTPPTPSSFASVTRLRSSPSRAGGVEMAELPSLELKNAAGDSAKVYPFGACVTSYVKGGTDVLMVRPDAKTDGSKPISGGIPLCFPQFGPGAIQQHGFARNLNWEVTEQSDDKVVMELKENDYTMEMWPHKFTATYSVTLTADALKTEFQVMNTGDKDLSFTGALHSYWSCSSIKNVKIENADLKGATFLDKMASPPADKVSDAGSISITKETDSVYKDITGDILLADSARKRPLTLSNSGWSDMVIWNPYGDEGMGYDGFVCVEAAQASSSVSLGPKEYWTGAMDIIP
jgi:glucose-6-phosphate 1-epimerase